MSGSAPPRMSPGCRCSLLIFLRVEKNFLCSCQAKGFLVGWFWFWLLKVKILLCYNGSRCLVEITYEQAQLPHYSDIILFANWILANWGYRSMCYNITDYTYFLEAITDFFVYPVSFMSLIFMEFLPAPPPPQKNPSFFYWIISDIQIIVRSQLPFPRFNS